MLLISNYHEFKKEEFLLNVINEDDEFYYVQHMPEDFNRFAEGDEITPLRKSLVGEDNLYCVYGDVHYEQMRLF